MRPHTTPYRQIKNNLISVAEEFKNQHRDFSDPFKGTNFLTREVVLRRRFRNKVWYELSYGTGMSGDWIFGVTFEGSDAARELSTCCSTFTEVSDLLKLGEAL
jgi:hypothetical protein